MNSNDYLRLAVTMIGGQTKLAGVIGVRQGHIWNWLNRDGQVPPEQAIPISRALNGEITPHQLRPDIYPNPTDGMPTVTKPEVAAVAE